MKKTITVLLILMLALSLLAGCGSKTEPGGPGDEQATQTGSNGEVVAAVPTGDLAAAYIGILTGDSYYVKYRYEVDFEDQKIEALMETATDGKNIAAITSMGSMGSSTVILKDEALYLVDHANKMVLVSSNNLLPNESAFPESGYAFKEGGFAELFGIERGYEEYSTDMGDVRFFFDADKLVGFESTMEGLVMQMEIMTISDTLPEGIFDIPDEYEVIDF